MNGSSNLIISLALVLVVSLAILLGLLLLLLVKLYCPTIIVRNAATLDTTTTTTTTTTTVGGDDIEKQVPHSSENQESNNVGAQKGSLGNSVNGCSLLYISNPIYDEENGGGTPFETPESSPSRLESGDDEKDEISLVVVKTPMKKVTIAACLKDVRSLGTSGSNTTSCSSLTPCTSPSL